MRCIADGCWRSLKSVGRREYGFAVAPGELSDVAAQLPRDFDDLIEAADVSRQRAATREDIVGRVAELLGEGRRTAEHATQARHPRHGNRRRG